jgi:hypothetical protein
VKETFFYCPTCGRQLKTTPADTSLFKQILIYGISFCLPPFGLGYAYRYYLLDDPTAKRIAIIATLLTIVSLVITLSLTATILSSAQSQIQDQMNMYKDLGI